MSDVSAPTTSSGDADLTGRKLGDFQILRRLGRGGMADVYLAEQGSLHRQVAFKVLRGSLASDEKYVRRFRHEALAAAKLSHANIVQIYGVDCVAGVHFIVQEYVKGQNLRQLLNRHASIDCKLAADIMRQVGAALHRAGQQGIIHRDIKPENIMLAATGEVKVTDFGLARVVQNGEAQNLTQIGMTMGTPLYMSPEQVEGKTVDQRSDLYSFGVTCYHMLAGHPPFTGETPLSIAVQHLKTEPARLEELRPDLPPGLCRVVHKLMAKLPQDRFASAAELLREIKTLNIGDSEWSTETMSSIEHELSGHDFTPTLATQQLQAVMQQTEAMRVLLKRRRMRWIPVAAAAAFLIGGLTAWFLRPEPLLAIDPNEKPGVAKQESVQDQYFFAAYSPVQSEAAYRAVWEYFPPTANNQTNLLYARRAKQRLAKLYRDENQPHKAEAIYREFVNLEPQETEFRAIGHLGLANIYAAQGEEGKDRVLKELSEATALINRLPAERRSELLKTLDESLRQEEQRRIDEP
jgi:serine/threonine-protein kinase